MSEAQQAEVKFKGEVYEGRYGSAGATAGKIKVGDFITNVYLPWAKANKRSWSNDHYMAPVLVKRFGNKTLRQVTPEMIERFKLDLRSSLTRKGTRRSEADTNRFLEMLSRVFTLAIEFRKTNDNPCRGRKFRLDNQRFRYLLPAEEPRLLSVLTGRRAHLRPQVIVALGTGLRKRELLNLRREHVDLARNLIVVTRTKSRRNREVPMNAQVREVMIGLCAGKEPQQWLFPNPQTGKPYRDTKQAFATACREARIQGLWWHDLRATFGTRLGEARFSLRYIMELMGHTDSQTCLRYVRATEAGKRAAVDAAMLVGNQKLLAWRLKAV